MDTDAAIKIRLQGEPVDGITELNISSLNLDHLDVHAFENMEFLEILDVSYNRLKSIPQLPLPNLKKLFCEVNMFKSVLFLKHFPSLEELFLVGNPLLLADRFIAVSILPKLMKLDNKDCSKLRELERMLEQRLRPQIAKVWETHFREKLHCNILAAELIAIQKQFISHMKRLPLLSLEVPSDFKNFKVKEMATEFFQNIVEEITMANRPVTRSSLSPEKVPRQSHSPLKSSQVDRSPEKDSNFKQRTDFSRENSLQHTPQKSSSRRSIVPTDALDEIILNVAIRVSPRKHKLTECGLQNGNTRDDIQSQSTLKKCIGSPRKASLRGQNVQENYTCSNKPVDRLTEITGSPNSTTISSPRNKLKSSSTLRGQNENHSSSNKPVERFTEISPNSTTISSPRNKLKSSSTLRGQNVNHSSSNKPVERFTEISSNSTTISSPRKKLKPSSIIREQNLHNCSSDKKSVEGFTEINPSSTSNSPPQKKQKASSPSTSSSYRKNLFGSSNATLEQQHHETSTSNIKPYSPRMFLRCHSRDGDPHDCGTQVWCAAFEPDVLQPGKTTTTVATCGGTNICLIDCSTGVVTKRYKHPDPNEDFYCLAWTVVQIGKSDASLIAAAGLNKEVLLLHPSLLVTYHTFKAHSRDINCLAFHKKMSTWLFTGSSDRTICLWDIGIPFCPELKTVCKKLAVFKADFEVLQLAISLNKNIVLGACDGALFAWTLNGVQTGSVKKKPQFQLQLPELENNKTTTVDGLRMLSDTHCAVKVARSGQIHICNLTESLKSVPNGNTKMKSVPLLVVGTLDWSHCKTSYLYLGACEDARILACGDDSGDVWIYDIHKFLDGPKTECSRDTKYKPVQMLFWPGMDRHDDKLELPKDTKVNINSVALSSNGDYLLACTNKNLACIWTTCISN